MGKVMLTAQERRELYKLLTPYLSHQQVQRMRRFIQHGAVTTYDHCERVTLVSFWLNRRLHLGADEKALVTGAFLHDFYLYDWHNKEDAGEGLHGFTHPKRACENAIRLFNISHKEQNIILCHMWPLTFRHIPRCREAVLVSLADKYCSSVETLFLRRKER